MKIKEGFTLRQICGVNTPEVALADVRTALNEWKEVGIVTI